MASVASGNDTPAPLPNGSEMAAMIWAFVLVAGMSAVAFAAVWIVTTALIATSH